VGFQFVERTGQDGGGRHLERAPGRIVHDHRPPGPVVSVRPVPFFFLGHPCGTWGDNSVSLTVEPKVLALVQEHFLWNFPYLERIQGVHKGVPKGPGPLE
jgi:hypothetical protein